jgi:hypothetical protein
MKNLSEYVDNIRNDVVLAQVELSSAGRLEPDVDAKFLEIWKITDELLEK